MMAQPPYPPPKHRRIETRSRSSGSDGLDMMDDGYAVPVGYESEHSEPPPTAPASQASQELVAQVVAGVQANCFSYAHRPLVNIPMPGR